MRDLLLSIGFFAIAVAGACYIVNLQGLEDKPLLIAFSPTTGIGIGGGVGALFGRWWRGIYIGLLIQVCQYVAGFFIFNYWG